MKYRNSCICAKTKTCKKEVKKGRGGDDSFEEKKPNTSTENLVHFCNQVWFWWKRIFMGSTRLIRRGHVRFLNRIAVSKGLRGYCCGSRTAAFVLFWPLDPGSGMEKNRIRDPRWNHISESLGDFWGVKILKFFYADPGFGIFLTLDPGWRNLDPGSGVNIPDLQPLLM